MSTNTLKSEDYLDTYIRVSSRSQEDSNSLKVQEELGLKVSKKLGLEMRLRNEKSGSSTTIVGREVLQDLMTDIENGEVKNVWCSERSRLFRDTVDSQMFRKDYLVKYNVRLYEGTDGHECHFDNLEEKLTYDIISQLQQYENDRRSLKSKQGKRFLLEKNIKNLHLGGTVLYGYRVVDKRLVIDEEESKWILFMFNSILQGKTTIDIKRELDRNGVKTRRTKSGLWNLMSIHKILSNESYCGRRTFYDKELKKEFVYRIDGIVSINTFRQVRQIMSDRQRLKNNNKKHFSIFDDILFVCECKDRIGSSVKKGVRKDKSKFLTKTYYCMSKQYSWKENKKSDCKNYKSMNMDLTDKVIVDVVKDTVSDSHLMKEKFKEDVLETKFDKDKDIEERRYKLEEKCKKIIKSIERTYDNLVVMETDLIQGRKEKRVVEMIINRLHDELEEQKNGLSKTEHEIDDLRSEEEWVNWMSKYSQNLELVTKDSNSKKQFINNVISKIIVRSDYGSDRDEKSVQIGHRFDLFFKMKVVNDKLIYEDETDKSLGYTIKEGRNKLTTESFSLRKSRGSVKKKD